MADEKEPKKVVKGFTIDKDIPLPPVGIVAGYPYAELEIGESFLYPKGRSKGHCSNANASANRALKPKRFRTIKVNEGGEERYRCWRVANKTD